MAVDHWIRAIGELLGNVLSIGWPSRRDRRRMLVGHQSVVSERIEANAAGQADLDGRRVRVRNLGSSPIEIGSSFRVIGVDDDHFEIVRRSGPNGDSKTEGPDQNPS